MQSFANTARNNELKQDAVANNNRHQTQGNQSSFNQDAAVVNNNQIMSATHRETAQLDFIATKKRLQVTPKSIQKMNSQGHEIVSTNGGTL